MRRQGGYSRGKLMAYTLLALDELMTSHRGPLLLAYQGLLAAAYHGCVRPPFTVHVESPQEHDTGACAVRVGGMAMRTPTGGVS